MIQDIRARKVLNSRGGWSVEVELKRENQWHRASVPAGKSRGRHEAVQVSAEESLKVFPKFREIVNHHEFQGQNELDDFLIQHSGENKSRFGVDLVLATSIAFFKSEMELTPVSLPTPMFNVINGGQHAGGQLAVQEFMAVPWKAEKFSGKLEAGVDIYNSLKEIILKKFGPAGVNVGDEGGFAPPIKTTEDALSLLENAVEKSGHSGEVSISMDMAASTYFDGDKYKIDGWKLPVDDYIDYVNEFARRFNLFSIEDPFAEEEFDGFARLLAKTSSMIVGDDLTATNLKRVEKARKLKSINCVLIKPNQIGTISETLKVIDFCRNAGWSWIISHRSGETEDSFIADLASLTESPLIKAGAPARGERTAKYNELLRLEELL